MSVWKEVPPMFRRQIVVCSLFIHQVSTSSLLDNLVSYFVSMGMVYCVMESFVTVVRACSRLIESCVGLTTSLYTGTLNWILKYPWDIDRTSSLCVLTCTTVGGRVSPVSSGVAFFNHLSSVVGHIPLTSLSSFSDTSKKKNVPKKVPLKIILRSSESHQIKLFEYHNFGIPLVVPDTAVFHHADTHI
jgi:hypothetical protein